MNRFTDNGDGTVTDTTTGLMWSKDDATPETVTHADAVKACADLQLAGHSDWRLPTIHELFGLVDPSRRRPAIDMEAFPDTKNDWYWTSTDSAWSSLYAWIVHFGDGHAYDLLRGDGACVRAVRSVAASQ